MEDRQYPGYANIDFQRRRHFVFSFFRKDLDSMARFSGITRGFLRKESEQRYEQLGAMDRAALASEGGRIGAARELEGSFVDLLLSWMVVAFYGRFEAFLAELCRAVHEESVHRHDPGFIRNIDEAKNFLKKVPGFKFPAGGSDWRDIKDLGELRHVIAHNNRLLLPREKDRHKAIQRISCVRVNERHEVWVRDGVLEHVVKTLGAFTDLLEKALGPTGQVPRNDD